MISTKIMFELMSLEEAESKDYISKKLCEIVRSLEMTDIPIIYIEADSDNVDMEYEIMKSLAEIHFDKAIVVTSVIIDGNYSIFSKLISNGFTDIDGMANSNYSRYTKNISVKFLFTENSIGKKIFGECVTASIKKGEIKDENSK